MKEKTIVIEIDEQGNCSMDLEGFHGKGCADVAKDFQGSDVVKSVRNKTLRQFLSKTSSQISRLLKRLRLHGLIKKVSRGYRYYLTLFGKHAIVTGLKLKELVLIPQLAAFTPS